MAENASRLDWLRLRAVMRKAVLALALTGMLPPGVPAQAQTPEVTGEATLTKPGEYARLLIKLSEDVESDVRISGSVLIVRFRRPVNVTYDKLEIAVPDFVSSVRRDPDGSALRFALNRKVNVNVMAAGERLFVDLLPESWSGLPPPLPQSVVQELAERARIAEKKLRDQQASAAMQTQPPIRVRTSMQPTFLRFIFELPDSLNVSTDLGKNRFAMKFEQAYRFDLADAKNGLTPNIAGIDQRIENERAIVELALIGDVDVHAFREDRSYIVDVGFDSSMTPNTTNKPAEPGQRRISAPETKPAVDPVEASVAKASSSIAMQAPPPAAVPAPAPKPVSETPAVADLPEMTRAPATPVTIPASDPAPVSPPSPVSPATPRSASVATMPGSPLVAVESERSNDALRLAFPFAKPVAAAMFQRGHSLWLVFDDKTAFDLDPVRRDGDRVIRNATSTMLDDGVAVRLDLARPKLASLVADGTRWRLTFADISGAPSQPLAVIRNIPEPSRASIAIPFASPGRLHRLVDPEAGDTLLVVTGENPVRGFIKQQNYLEFSILDSVHGVLLQPKSDDLSVELATDKIVVGRPGGLTLSAGDLAQRRSAVAPAKPAVDLDSWKLDSSANFLKRLDRLMTDASSASSEHRLNARLDLARFYMARGLYPEAKGVLDVVLAEFKAGHEEPVPLVLRAAANILSGHPAAGLTDLSNPAVGSGHDSGLWRALALARQGKWSDAREQFKNFEMTVSSLPIDLQQIMLLDAARSSIEVRDFAGASGKLDELAGIGVPVPMKPAMSVLRGRLAESLGTDEKAEDEYHEAAISKNRPAAADATWRLASLKMRKGSMSEEDALAEIETLAMTWRGDDTEIATLNLLTRLYAGQERYRDSFMASRAATLLKPNAPAAREMQDRSSELFSQLYLTPKGEGMPPVDALAMFYEFRELTPIGRRGDEMIRRLADRLVAVDLLDQASELLQYQIDKRLEGAARATVATRLAMVYLMNRKPERAIAALQGARMADLAGELRQQRLLLEARAQSDIGRHELAYDLVSNISGREATRLRADIRWAARRWGEGSEQIELLYGERWRDFQPLAANEKSDILRAAIGYSLAEDSIGLSRLREKYAPKFTEEADRKSFDAATRLDSASGAQLSQIAKMAASVDTLDGFLREMKVRFPDVLARAPLPPETKDVVSTGALSEIPRGLRPVGLKPVAR
jgi:hypothetical protein